jgi:hypothetical protein
MNAKKISKANKEMPAPFLGKAYLRSYPPRLTALLRAALSAAFPRQIISECEVTAR